MKTRLLSVLSVLILGPVLSLAQPKDYPYLTTTSSKEVGGYSDLKVYKNTYVLCSGSKKLSVYDIRTGNFVKTIEFPGNFKGKSYIDAWFSPNGDYVAGTSQHYKNANRSGFHFHDVATGKTQSYEMPQYRQISEAGFAHNSKQMFLIYSDRADNAGKNKVQDNKLVIYDPISKAEKELYNKQVINNTGYAGIPVHAQFSNDDTKIYVYINEDGLRSRFNIYQVADGKLLFSKVYNYAFHFFEDDKFLYLSGNDEVKSHVPSVTTKHDKNTMKQLAKWDFKLETLSPEGFGLSWDTQQKKLVKVDLRGHKEDFMEVDLSKIHPLYATFSQDMNYLVFPAESDNKRDVNGKRTINEIGLYIYRKTEGEAPISTVSSPVKKWHTYQGTQFDFSLDFPTQPKVELSKNSKGSKVTKLQAADNNYAYNAVVTEVSKTVKPYKYEEIAKNTVLQFIKNGDYKVVSNKSYAYGDYKGVEYHLEKGNIHYKYHCIGVDGALYSLIFVYASENAALENQYFGSFKPHLKEDSLMESWTTYTSKLHGYTVIFPKTPDIKSKKTSDNRSSTTVMSKDNGEIYMVLSTQHKKGIKTSQYQKMAEDTAESFAKKTGGTLSNKQVRKQKVSYQIKKGNMTYLYQCHVEKGQTHQLFYIWEKAYNTEKTNAFFNSFKSL